MTTQLSKVNQTLDSSIRQNKKNDVVDGGGDLVTSTTHSPNITKESMDQAMPVPTTSESSDMTDNENEEDTSEDYSNPEMYFPPDFEGLESIELVDGESNTVTEPENASNGAPNPISIEEFDKNLPSTVKLLTTPDGGKLYLVGTAHFSVESRNDVSMVIQAVQPHIVVVELCKSRIGLLHCDEDAIDQFTKNFTFGTILGILQNEGLYSGLVQILMQRMAMRIANELGLSPGGEFRRAFLEAKKIPHCAIHIADRPIDITIQRALRSMSWWQFLKVGWHLFTMKGLVTPGEVELFKRHEMLEDMVASVSQEFPELGEVFIKERDIYMAYCLQISCLQLQTPTGTIPARVVGVVGLGHTPGILQYWRKVQPSDIPPLLRVPPMSLSSKILLYTFKASFVGAILYVGYKIIPVPVPSGITLESIKSSVMGLLKVSGLQIG